ncbi:putative Regulatory protein, LysR:LysR, substrate-binding [Candidatus Terasakiella magnetica]|uniref:Putative Regulatory protein, LysR:LysR, substrate-binding n=1 Tax=Candidatus Terasakiella magnetica TaxID=1867952 RepID=A0A1C3RGD7_9PROT|nr:LysR family transcriptional regulator [Candidatus Terasakiella magnetica]SCA56363.1 putative Regulatory protein, LysR:LysR, substrate-binding [Candidatus Terasakiella magnetica]
MQNWDDLRFFLTVARNGSFSAAAESLSVNASTVGRRIDQLEINLKCKLFDRQRYGMTLTPDGRHLLDHVQKMEKSALDLDSMVKGSDEALNGQVRISVTDGLGSFWLTPNLANFQRDYPQISLEVMSESHFVDLAAREADIAIRLSEPTQNALKIRKVGMMKFHVFAAPAYLDGFGMPSSWADLKGHKLVDYLGYQESKALSLWQETVKNHDNVVFQTNSAMSFVSALRSGMGIGMLPQFYRHTVSDLIIVDLPTDLFEMPIYLVTHEETSQTARIKAVKDYINDLFDRDRKSWFS